MTRTVSGPRRAAGRVRLLLVAAVACGLVATAAGPTVSASRAAVPPPAARTVDRPNIVVVMTDDQNREELAWMPKTRRLLGGHGVTFTEALSPAPVCCPARAMFATGQYGQNNGVQHNGGPYGGFSALRDPDNTLAAWLQEAGYRTALVGKYLNGYEAEASVQAGWNRWNPLVGRVYDYVRAVLLVDGERKRHQRHVTGLLGDYSARYVRQFAAEGRPFFLHISHVAPHFSFVRRGSGELGWGSAIASKRHRRALLDVRAPSLDRPSFNRSGDDDPYGARRELSPERMQQRFTGKVQSLQDVDDTVQKLVRVLRRTGVLEDTYIVLVSDNGMLLGEHGLSGKSVLYREALEVPLVVRVPGTREARTSSVPVTIVDLAPTILDLAGAAPGRVQDGASFAPLLHGRQQGWRDTQLVQTGSRSVAPPSPGWEFRGVWTPRFTYMRHAEDGREYVYDRDSDPYELEDVAGLPRYRDVVRELRDRHDALVDCAGEACDRSFGPLPPVR